MKSKKYILFVFGTRPEAIKLAPLIIEAKKNSKLKVKVCVTGQHREMLDQVLSFFNIRADFDLDIMKSNQSLSGLTANLISKLEKIIGIEKPDCIIVQGDTTTAYTAALVGFYNNTKIAHIEAGLRSNSIKEPFPEEFNRVSISKICNFHFTPSKLSSHNLLIENVDKKDIYEVGNTVIDALLLTLKKITPNFKNKFIKKLELDSSKKIILITGHRRESFGKPFENICNALKKIAKEFPNIELIYPVHLNPNVKKIVHQILSDQINIKLINPVSYPEMAILLQQCSFIITDSGGIQEEAPALGKPVLVTRNVTERKEVIESGNAILVGTNPQKIFTKAKELIVNKNLYQKMNSAVNPYGNGNSSEKIIEVLKKLL